MRQYKNFIIPDRRVRDNNDIEEKQTNYCHKSDCHNECKVCLFSPQNIYYFEEWYLLKNSKNAKDDSQ